MRSEKQIRRTISNLTSSISTMRDVVQTTLIETAGHAHQHGRGTLAEELFTGATALNQRKLRTWLAQYSCVRMSEDGKATICKKTRSDFDGDGDALITELTARAVQWWEVQANSGAGSDPKPLDVAKSLKDLAKRVSKARDDGREIKADLAEMRAALMALQSVLEHGNGNSEAAPTRKAPEPARIDTLDGAMIRELRMAA